MFFKTGDLKNSSIFTRKHLFWSLLVKRLLKVLCQKETPIQVFSCQFCKIFKNSFCYRTPVAAFDLTLPYTLNDLQALPVLIMSYIVSACVYRKPTVSGVYTHFDSFFESTYKLSTVYSLTYRCFRI